MYTIVIDGKVVKAAAGTTVLAAARSAGINIPTLCHHDAVEPFGGCRLCVVDVTLPNWNDWYKMVISCMYPVTDGLIVATNTKRVQATRTTILDLLLARSPNTPLIIELARQHGIEKSSFTLNPNPSDCILCGLCTRVCDKIGPAAISAVGRNKTL